MKSVVISLMMTLVFGAFATAQDSVPTLDRVDPFAPPATETQPKEFPKRWLLLCCGLPGDQEHRDRLTGAMEKIIAAAEPVLGVLPERLRVLAGDDQMQSSLTGQVESLGVCTKDSVAAAMAELCDQVGAEDSCWVMLLGHAHLYESSSKFNVLDTDFDQSDFAVWARPLACREQVFWITMPASGFWLKPLTAQSRVVISATEADLEITGTEMPYALADLLDGQGEQQSIEDVDQDGSLTLLDLYLAANLEVHGRFTAMERLQTEHAQLEDNGDGRGTEIQLGYLPLEEDDEEEGDDEEGDESEDDESEPNPDDGEAGESKGESVEDENDEDATAENTESDEPEADEDAATLEIKSIVREDIPKPISNRNLDGFRSRFIVIRIPGQ